MFLFCALVKLLAALLLYQQRNALSTHFMRHSDSENGILKRLCLNGWGGSLELETQYNIKYREKSAGVEGLGG